jgi:hypothetical protein
MLCLWGHDVDPQLHSRKQTPEYVMETSSIACQKEVCNSTVDSFARKEVLEHYQERVTTLNSVYCSAMLQDQLKPAI